MELLTTLSDSQFQGIPSTLFINTEENKISLEVGFKTPEEFKPLLAKYEVKK
jgi:hypothetical protein